MSPPSLNKKVYVKRKFLISTTYFQTRIIFNFKLKYRHNSLQNLFLSYFKKSSKLLIRLGHIGPEIVLDYLFRFESLDGFMLFHNHSLPCLQIPQTLEEYPLYFYILLNSLKYFFKKPVLFLILLSDEFKHFKMHENLTYGKTNQLKIGCLVPINNKSFMPT